MKIIELPNNEKPFLFAGTHVYTKYATCATVEITNKYGLRNYIRLVVFVLPPTPIPYLLGVKIARDLSFYLYLIEHDRSHLIIHKLKFLHQLVVKSHEWLKFKPCNQNTDQCLYWSYYSIIQSRIMPIQ